VSKQHPTACENIVDFGLFFGANQLETRHRYLPSTLAVAKSDVDIITSS
jgi:hypothetical protein